MNSKRLLIVSVSVAISSAMSTLTELPVQCKHWTVEQRQAKLMQDVNAGQKSGALTEKESRKLRKNLANVARKKARMKSRTTGNLNTKDDSELQSSIDKTSTKIKNEKVELPRQLPGK